MAPRKLTRNKLRAVIILKHQGLPYSEIAKRLDVSKNTVRYWLSKMKDHGVTIKTTGKKMTELDLEAIVKEARSKQADPELDAIVKEARKSGDEGPEG